MCSNGGYVLTDDSAVSCLGFDDVTIGRYIPMGRLAACRHDAEDLNVRSAHDHALTTTR